MTQRLSAKGNGTKTPLIACFDTDAVNGILEKETLKCSIYSTQAKICHIQVTENGLMMEQK